MNSPLHILNVLLVGIAIWSSSFSPDEYLGFNQREDNTLFPGRQQVIEFLVRGSVSDSNGPLEGVSVSEKGKTKGSRSDADGNFEILVSGPDAILVFSFVGYETLEFSISGKAILNITMQAGKSQELSEVIITALGLSRAKKSLGYSVGEIKGEDMNRVTQTNVLSGMAAKVSGVNVSSTGGSPTASVSVIIRGIHSLNSDNQPLFVIDGAPVKNSMNNISTNMGNDNDIDYGNAISDLNPNDIESISILKGPSAAALYGSRAGNGVVIITTKTGKKSNGIGITFNSITEFDIPYHYLPTNQSYTVGNHAYTTPNESNSWNGKIVDLAGTDTYRFGTPLNMGIKAIQWNSPLLPDSSFAEQELVSHNNLKNFMQTGLTSINSISVENASEKDIYRFSYANLFNQGIVPNTGVKRNNLAFNLQHSVTRSFRINLSLNFVNAGSDNIVAGNDGGVLKDVAYLSPSIDIRQMKNYWVTPGIQQFKALPPVGVESASDTPRNHMANTGFDNNPWFTLNQVKNSFKRNRLFGNVKLDYSFSSHVNAFLRYSQDLYNESRESKISKSYNSEVNGYYGIQNLYNTESNTDFLVTYNNNFGNFNLSASAGGNMLYAYSSNLQTYSQSGAGIIAPELFNVSNIAQANLRSVSGYSEKMIYSLYAMASIGFRDMAYLDLTGRNDWSSTLPPNNYSYFYPSASLAILLSRIFDFGPSVSLAKLRAGWANVGKDTDPYNLYGTIGIGSFGGTTTQQSSSTIKNPNLKPEQAISTELGLELAFFKNRLRFDGTVYQADYENQILNINTPPSSGYTSRQINAGLIRTRGIEIQIGGTIVSNKNWRWDLTLNYTRNNSYVISLSNNVPFFLLWKDGESGSWTYAKGQRIPNAFNADGSPIISDGKLGQLWDNRVVTVTDKSSLYYGYPILGSNGYYQKVADGDFNYKEVVGNFNPKWLMGMQTSLRYKFLTLTASFDMRLGGTFFSQTYRYLQSDGVMARQMNIGIPIPNEYKQNIPEYLNSNSDKFVKFSGLQQFHLVGGPNVYKGGFPYTDGGITFNDGAFYPGVYLDANGRYVENLGDPNLTKFDYYTDAVTTPSFDFARMNMFDASYIKMREITISVELPARFANSLKLQGISLGIFSKNIILWTKAKAGIDPELAFQYQTDPQGNGSQFRQGIERYNITPWSIPVGVNLNVRF
ncbi:MAG: SusC/RagA family TonB-linked outer membrane protein [Chitinophagales bacterium]